MLKLVLELCKHSNDALALSFFLLVLTNSNCTVNVVNCTCLFWLEAYRKDDALYIPGSRASDLEQRRKQMRSGRWSCKALDNRFNIR